MIDAGPLAKDILRTNRKSSSQERIPRALAEGKVKSTPAEGVPLPLIHPGERTRRQDQTDESTPGRSHTGYSRDRYFYFAITALMQALLTLRRLRRRLFRRRIFLGRGLGALPVRIADLERTAGTAAGSSQLAGNAAAIEQHGSGTGWFVFLRLCAGPRSIRQPASFLRRHP